MTISDFGLGILASWLANQMNVAKKSETIHTTRNETIPDTNSKGILKKSIRLFKTYDIYHDFDEVFKYTGDSIAHILVEIKPSNFYNLTSIVMVSKTTEEWFVFNRGRTAFQGTGGGISQSKEMVKKFKSNNILVVAWAIEQDLLNDFENGIVVWQEVKQHLVPLMSAIAEQPEWASIQETANELLRE
jgi:hypothetical protein